MLTLLIRPILLNISVDPSTKTIEIITNKVMPILYILALLAIILGMVIGYADSNLVSHNDTIYSGFLLGIIIAFSFYGWLESDRYREKVDNAEKKAYEISQNGQNTIEIGRLFYLYSSQIEKYQKETRTRATLSFLFAILSMSAGMGFMFWGGSFILLADPNANHVAAGAAISAIGGGISAYITTTFLDVHKLSLTQLNRYFTQPVINDHIVMAQRLAEDVKDDEVRKKSYEKIVSSITALIDATNAELHKSSAK